MRLRRGQWKGPIKPVPWKPMREAGYVSRTMRRHALCDTYVRGRLCHAERERRQTMQREFAKLPAKLAEEPLPAYRRPYHRGSSSMAEVPAGSSASPPEAKKLPKRRSWLAKHCLLVIEACSQAAQESCRRSKTFPNSSHRGWQKWKPWKSHIKAMECFIGASKIHIEAIHADSFPAAWNSGTVVPPSLSTNLWAGWLGPGPKGK